MFCIFCGYFESLCLNFLLFLSCFPFSVFPFWLFCICCRCFIFLCIHFVCVLLFFVMFLYLFAVILDLFVVILCIFVIFHLLFWSDCICVHFASFCKMISVSSCHFPIFVHISFYNSLLCLCGNFVRCFIIFFSFWYMCLVILYLHFASYSFCDIIILLYYFTNPHMIHFTLHHCGSARSIIVTILS